MQDIYFAVYHQGGLYMKNTVYPVVENTEAGDSDESAVLQTSAASIRQTEEPHGDETNLFPWLIGAAVLLAVVIAAVLHFSGKPKQGGASVPSGAESFREPKTRTRIHGAESEPMPDTCAITDPELFPLEARTKKTVPKDQQSPAPEKLEPMPDTCAITDPELFPLEARTKKTVPKNQQSPAPEEAWREYFTLDEEET